jgi:hypothetical protein
MYFMKTEVYSWRVSAELKTMLEREVRRSKTPVSELLDLAVRDLLQAGAPLTNSRFRAAFSRNSQANTGGALDDYSGSGGSSHEGGGSTQPSTGGGIATKVCRVIPSGATSGLSGGVGGIGSLGGGGELVVNYNSGQVSAFGFGGAQVGWNGGLSGSAYSGFIYGLNDSNSNYAGGFTGINGGAGLGFFLASSSGGFAGGARGLAVHPSAPGAVTAGGISFGGGLVSGFSGGVTATTYTNPVQLGKFSGFGPMDATLYAARQLCK